MRGSLLLLLVAASLLLQCVSAQKSCPDNCSGHGRCVGSRCRCDADYYGIDCSMEVIEISPGDVERGTLTPRSWAYYSFPVLEEGRQVTFNLQQGPSRGDCDLYLRNGSPPTRRHWDKRDNGVAILSSLEVESSDPRGTWYVGILAYASCEFTLTADSPLLACPDGCGGHGECSRGVCTCNDGWGGDGCEFVNKTLTPGVQIQSQRVRQGEWAFFYYDVASENEHYTVSMDADADADLYARRGAFPTRFDWDAHNTSVPEAGQHDFSTLELEGVEVDRWYFGVYGYEASTFSIKLDGGSFQGSQCDNQCSGESHGTCTSGRCHCNVGYSGVACQTADTQLLFGQQTGYVEDNQWNYYRVNTFTDGAVNIRLQEKNADADCDLYVNRGSNPTRTNFTSAHLGFEDDFTLTIEDAGQETYYVGVYGWRTCSYSISLVDTPADNCGCENGATCSESGECECSGAWGGVKCEVPVVTLASGASKTGSVKQNEWAYYRLPAATSRAYSFAMKEKSSDPGLLWLYVNNRDTPTLDVYDLRDKSTDSNTHLITLTFEESDEREFLIGVYGSPYISDPARALEFSVDAWYFPESK